MVIVKHFQIKCPTNKINYANPKHAFRSIVNLNIKRGDICRYYRCPICKNIHLTSS